MRVAGTQIGAMELSGIKDTQDSIQLEVSDSKQRRLIASVVERYQLKMSVDNINKHGAAFDDLDGRCIGIAHGNIRGNLLHTGKPYCDIMILGTAEGMQLGWIESSKMSDAQDRFLVPVKALNPMPQEFRFAQPCPHLSVYGGYIDPSDGNWRCFGCDLSIPFVG